jgi:hypothetical protein
MDLIGQGTFSSSRKCYSDLGYNDESVGDKTNSDRYRPKKLFNNLSGFRSLRSLGS